MNTQLRLGRYACPVCPERFGSVGEKKAHIRVHHSSTTKKAKS